MDDVDDLGKICCMMLLWTCEYNTDDDNDGIPDDLDPDDDNDGIPDIGKN